MIRSKFTVVLGCMIGITLMGVAAHAKDAPEKPAKVAADTANQARGTIASVEGDTITMGAVENGQKVQKSFTLTDKTEFLLAADAKGGQPTPGKREQVVAGSSVTMTLDADGKTIKAITIAGRNTNGVIESIEKDSITVTGKGKEGKAATQYRINDATIVNLASVGKEKGAAQRGTLADLKPGMQVNLSISAAEKDLVRSITVQPEGARPEKPAKPGKDAK